MTNEQSNDSIRLVPLMGIAAISALLASGVQFALSSGDASAHAGSGSTPVVAAVDGKRVPFGLEADHRSRWRQDAQGAVGGLR